MGLRFWRKLRRDLAGEAAQIRGQIGDWHRPQGCWKPGREQLGAEEARGIEAGGDRPPAGADHPGKGEAKPAKGAEQAGDVAPVGNRVEQPFQRGRY